MKKEEWWFDGNCIDDSFGEENWNEEIDYNTDEYHHNQDIPTTLDFNSGCSVINYGDWTTTHSSGTNGTSGSSGKFSPHHNRFIGKKIKNFDFHKIKNNKRK